MIGIETAKWIGIVSLSIGYLWLGTLIVESMRKYDFPSCLLLLAHFFWPFVIVFMVIIGTLSEIWDTFRSFMDEFRK